MTRPSPSPLIIVPAWNEEASVGAVVRELRAHDYAVVVVDDGSADATSERAREAGATVLRLPVNQGVGGALRCGFRWAVQNGFRSVIQVDADGQHPVADIAKLIRAADEADVHIVIGSRFAGEKAGMEIGLARRLAMWRLGRSASRATGVRITDATSGFRIIREPLLSAFAQNFPAHYLGDTYEAVVSAGRAGYRAVEIPVEMSPRTHGTSSASTISAIRFLVRSMIVASARLQFNLPQPSERSA